MTKKTMVAICNAHDIPVSEDATNRQLQWAINTYFNSLPIIRTDKGYRRMLTDKPTKEYSVDFTVSGYYMVKAESEEVAKEWVEDKIRFAINTGDCEGGEIDDYYIGDILEWREGAEWGVKPGSEDSQWSDRIPPPLTTETFENPLD